MSTRGKKTTTEDFILKATEIHNNKFDYSLVEYKNTHTKVKIICPIHGPFEQLPMDHLKGNGCRLCSGKGVALSADNILQRIQDQLGNKYDYSKVVYVNRNTKITISCPNHGDFDITPHAILTQHQECKQCGNESAGKDRRNTTESFVTKALEIHKGKYTYDKTVYITSIQKVIITCPIHGDFLQSPTSHVDSARGCPKCRIEKLRERAGGYTFKYFENHPEEQDIPGILYVAEIFNGNEHFLKVGITAKDTDFRFNRSEYKGMTINVIRSKYTTLYEAFRIEQSLIESLKPYKFFSNSKFSGYTECFRICEEVENGLNSAFKVNG